MHNRPAVHPGSERRKKVRPRLDRVDEEGYDALMTFYRTRYFIAHLFCAMTRKRG